MEIGFTEMEKMGASRKALIFTESRRTQDYLKTFLEANGYAGRIVLFNGSNTDPESSAIFEQWLRDNADTGRISGSRTADRRSAIIEHFDSHAINPRDSEFEVVYINGDHNIPSVLMTTEEDGGITKTLRLRQIEPEFLSRMFEE